MLKKDENGNNFNLHFFSYEQGRKALQSATVWAAWLDEQAPVEVIEEVWGRLRAWSHKNMFLYSLTPLEPDPWLQDIYDRRHESEIAGLWKFYHLNTESNPHISEDWKKNYLDSLPPDVRLTRQYGQFASYRGAVYPEFTNDLIINPIDVSKGRKFIGIDFGFRNPAAVWMSLYNDNWYVYQDMQLHDTMPEDFADKVLQRGYDHTHKVIVDYEDAISRRYFNNKGIATTNARKNVIDGINHVKGLMFQKKFFVFKQCKEAIKQLKSYRWKEYNEKQEVKDEVYKVDNHICIARGQLIDTPNGLIPVERLRVGDLVYTHLGVAELQCIQSQGEKEVIKLYIEDSHITCTPNHQIKTSNGWMDAIICKDIYRRNKCKSNHMSITMGTSQNMLNMEDINGSDTLISKGRRTMEIDHILEDQKEKINLFIFGCINKYGLTTLEKFLQEFQSTILMEIQETTKLKISNSRLVQIIQEIMDLLKLHEKKLKSGMPQKMEEIGTQNMEKKFGKIENKNNTFAKNVKKNSTLKHTLKNSVQTLANQKIEENQELMMRQDIVCFVETISTQINTLRRNAAPSHVLANCVGVKEINDAGCEEVFTLKTSDGTFFVNNVLVSNCDGIRYILHTMKKSEIKPWQSTIPGNSAFKIVPNSTRGLFGR